MLGGKVGSVCCFLGILTAIGGITALIVALVVITKNDEHIASSVIQ